MSIISSYQARLESPRIKPEERPEIQARTKKEGPARAFASSEAESAPSGAVFLGGQVRDLRKSGKSYPRKCIDRYILATSKAPWRLVRYKTSFGRCARVRLTQRRSCSLGKSI